MTYQEHKSLAILVGVRRAIHGGRVAELDDCQLLAVDVQHGRALAGSAGELVDVTQGAAALGNLAPVAVFLAQWRHSAEVFADPVLLDILTRDQEGDLGPVPPPSREE